jgi:hypothetical protein
MKTPALTHGMRLTRVSVDAIRKLYVPPFATKIILAVFYQ